MKSLNLLIKPASGLCNMRCSYCFYADEMNLRQEKSAIMKANTAEALIRAAYAAVQNNASVSFAFQGGEPTLAGLDFFKSFVKSANEKNDKSLSLSFSLQTNGLLLSEEWADFFKENDFLVGVSLDGYASLHDALRLDEKGGKTYERISKNIQMLIEKGVPVNLLCVINALTAKHPKEVYSSLKDLGSGFLQFIPCLDPINEKRGEREWSLLPEDYAFFLRETFDEWFKDWQSGNYQSVRQFNDWVLLLMGMPPSSCASIGSCGGYLVAEANGILYPCDFYALDEWKLGSVFDDIKEIMNSKKMLEFRQRSADKPEECSACEFFRICRAGCPRDWEIKSGAHNYYCSAFKEFFSYAKNKLMFIAAKEKQYLYFR